MIVVTPQLKVEVEATKFLRIDEFVDERSKAGRGRRQIVADGGSSLGLTSMCKGEVLRREKNESEAVHFDITFAS